MELYLHYPICLHRLLLSYAHGQLYILQKYLRKHEIHVHGKSYVMQNVTCDFLYAERTTPSQRSCDVYIRAGDCSAKRNQDDFTTYFVHTSY